MAAHFSLKKCLPWVWCVILPCCVFDLACLRLSSFILRLSNTYNILYYTLQLCVLMERCVWWRGSQSGRGDWRCVSVRGGALSVVMDGLTPTPTSSAVTSDMKQSLVTVEQ